MIAPKPQRRLSKSMTIAIGFRCKDGVILCADTQETFDGTKRNVPKLVVKDGSTEDIPLVLAVAGAGDGPFIDRLITDVWRAIGNCQELDDACLAADDEILRVYDRYASSFGGNMPSVELVYAIRSRNGVRLFHASGQIVNEVGHRSIGVGHILSDYLTERVYFDDMYVTVALQVATYILKETKQYVDGCGGESHIVLIPDEGIPYFRVPQDDIAKREGMYKYSDIFMEFMKHRVSNPDFPQESVEQMVNLMRNVLIRKNAELRADAANTKTLIAGTTPSTPRSSEDQP